MTTSQISFYIYLLMAVLGGFHSITLDAQCNNAILFPAATLGAPQNAGDTTVMSISHYAGDYARANGFQSNKTYIFTSNVANDFITLRTENRDSVLAFGLAPLSYTIDSILSLSFHLNLSVPVCGTQTLPRTTRIILPIPSMLSKVGINEQDPEATLDVNGKLKIGNDNDDPAAGMIRWNQTAEDFEGYDGQKWRSLTKASAKWGPIPQEKVNEIEKITAADTTFQKHFGNSVDLDGDYAIVGAVFDNNANGISTGSAYIFHYENNNWIQQEKLIPFDGANDDQFGGSVAIDGDYVVIGASGATVNGLVDAGAAYVYKRTAANWNFVQKITASNPTEFIRYGETVAIDETRIVIDAQFENNESGAVYIYELAGNTWGNEFRLVPNNAAVGDKFGVSIAISEELLIVGATGADVNGMNNQGTAYIFRYSAGVWIQETQIYGSVLPDTFFGSNVDIEGEYAIVGAPFIDNGNSAIDGTVFIYHKNPNWNLQSNLTLDEDQSGLVSFGRKVAINNNTVAVGVSRLTIDGLKTDQGAVFVFKRNGDNWNKETKLQASDGARGDRFGINISLDGDKILVGSRFDVLTGNDLTGSAYFFEKCQ